MAFNVNNWGVIAGGATIGVGFNLNNHSVGSQWAMGLPEDANNTLTTSNFRASFNSDSTFTYAFDLHCNGVGCRFSLNGGGQT